MWTDKHNISKARTLAVLLLVGLALPLCHADPLEFEVGLQTEYVEYEEPRFMSEKGLLAGIFLDGRTKISSATFRLFSSFVVGDVRYQSHPRTRLDLSGYASDIILDARAEAGYERQAWHRRINAYTGFGYRLLTDDLPDMSKFPGYKREQVYYYFPIGVDMDLATVRNWDLSARIEYDHLLEGQNTCLGDTVKQDGGWGLRTSVKADHETPDLPVCDRFGTEVFIQYWDIERSDRSWRKGLLEPANTSLMIGVRISTQF
jgi:hypothetical protein